MQPGGEASGGKDLLRILVDGTAAETGTGFFRALVQNLSRALGTCGATASGKSAPPRAGVLAQWRFREPLRI